MSDKVPEFKRYAPAHVSSDVLCKSVNASFGAPVCFVTGATVHLVHPRFLDAVQALAESVDTSMPGVDLSLTFLEVAGSSRDGFAMSLIAKVLDGEFGVSINNPTSSSVLSIKGLSLTAVLDVLKTDSRFRQVANPSGYVDHGGTFSISIGDEVPTLASQSKDQSGQLISNVVYRPSGVLMSVTPRVIAATNGFLISADVDAQVSSFQATTTGVNGSPTLSKRQLKTSLTLADGDVVVLGGLNGSKSTNNSSSFLGLPLGTAGDSQKSELVLLLQAKVSKPSKTFARESENIR